MLLRCINNVPSSDQQKALEATMLPGETFHLTVGDEYVALGLEVWKGLVWVEIAENERTVTSAPLFLFEIIDGQLSQHWTARQQPDGLVRLWPELFYERAFHDRLSNGAPELVSRFVELRRILEAEAR